MLRILLGSIISTTIASTAVFSATSVPKSFQQPVVFEPNRGQAPQGVTWIARAPGYTLFITGDGATMMLPVGTAEMHQQDTSRSTQMTIPSAIGKHQDTEVSTVRMKLAGSHVWNTAVGLEPTGGVSNYFIGSDPKAWKRDIPQYKRLSVPGVYDGVDLVFYSDRNQLEYDFIVAPGADPKKIQLAFEGTERLRVDGAGDLILTASGGSEIHHLRPHVYQREGTRTVDVASGYSLLDTTRASFALASYDRHRDLIIDPTVSFTRFLAGSSADIGNAIASDTAGNSYVTGITLSVNFPVVNPYHPAQGGAVDAFLTKLDPNGTIIFSTYFGGIGTDIANGIAVDSTGVYITGSTLSSDFPGRRNLPVNSQPDMFVTKFPLTGGIWIYSFETGGTSFDSGQAIAVDAQHQAYITGFTYSADFPKVGYALTNFYGNATAFFMKVSAAGVILDSTYLGGSRGDLGYGIAVDGLSSPWITGMTCSSDFPQTLPVTAAPGCNTFVTRLSPALNAYEFSGQFGGGNSRGSAIAVDGGFYGYVTGTTSANFPTTPGAFQTSLPTTQGSAFVMKIGFLGDIYYSTYLGAKDGYTNGTSIAPGREGEVYISGLTSSSAFPGAPALTPNPTAGFITRMLPTFNGLNYTTLLGAAINGIALYYPSPSILVPPQIFTTGWRYTGVHDYFHEDAFVVKLIQ